MFTPEFGRVSNHKIKNKLDIFMSIILVNDMRRALNLPLSVSLYNSIANFVVNMHIASYILKSEGFSCTMLHPVYVL